MATDATGTPSTNYSIPKYLTSGDAPSGKGLNAIVDFLDNLLKTGFTSAPASLASGEVPVWNGTTFVRSSVTGIGTVSAYQIVNSPGANTDITLTNTVANVTQVSFSGTGGGTIRSLSSITAPAGARVVFTNLASTVVVIKQLLAGGTGHQLYHKYNADLYLQPNDSVEYIHDGGTTWVEVGRNQASLLRKTTVKVVTNTVTPTDLLNGEITIPANAIGPNGILRFTAHFDVINNTGSTQATPTFVIQLGGTTLVTHQTLASVMSSNGAGMPMRIQCSTANQNSASSQWSSSEYTGTAATAASQAATGGGEGYSYAAAPVGGVGPVFAYNAGSTAIDTTSSRALTLLVTNPVANASYSTTLKFALVELI